MDRVLRMSRAAAIGLLSVSCVGCSTLGLTLYPAGAVLTTEAHAVLESSRIPQGIARENAKVALPSHVLQPGDAVLVEPVNLERDLRLPADQTVMSDGSLDLGPYGRVIVAGREIEQAEMLIEQQIVSQIREQRAACRQYANETDQATIDAEALPDSCDGIAINVRLLEPVQHFYVLGEVNAPGSYPLSGHETVLDAIVAAGGLSSSANPCKILLARPTDPCDCRITLPVCYREIVQLGNTASNYQLRPNDRIFVASRSCMDELLFWRASKPCERCSGCNKASRDPSMASFAPMAVEGNTMIPPGSVGWTSVENDPLLPSDFVDRTSGTTANDLNSSPRFQMNGAQDGPLIVPQSDLKFDRGNDVDGELDFKALPGVRPN